MKHPESFRRVVVALATCLLCLVMAAGKAWPAAEEDMAAEPAACDSTLSFLPRTSYIDQAEAQAANEELRHQTALAREEQAQRMALGRLIEDLVPPEYRDLVLQVAEQYGMDPRILAAVGSVESQWYANATGDHGDSGLMQILPSTARWIADTMGLAHFDLYDPRTNLNMGAWYLYQLNREYGNWGQALAAYNGGPRAAPLGEQHPYAKLVLRVYGAQGR